MPKIVDHDQRRRDLVQATLRIIARQGLSGATMRDIATEAGFANGAIKPYFATKSDLLAATYLHVFESTNERVDRAVAGLAGLAALDAFGREVLPLNDALRDEARVVLAFWGEVAQSEVHVHTTRPTMEQWRAQIISWLEQARDADELASGIDTALEADLMLTHMMGAQVNRITDGDRFDGAAFTHQLEYWLRRLAAPVSA